MLTADDPRIDALPAATAALLRQLLPLAPKMAEEWARFEPLEQDLFASVGIERIPYEETYGAWTRRDVLAPEALTADQRALLVLLAEVPGLRPTKYPVYASRTLMRRWLGLAPAGALFSEVAHEGRRMPRIDVLRASARTQDASEAIRHLEALPVGERVECLCELIAAHDDWNVLASVELLDDAREELRGEAGAWARAAASEWTQQATIDPRRAAIERAIFVALVRAKQPIVPRWDAMVPLADGSFYAGPMNESLAALPEARREPAVLARLARCNRTESAGAIALSVLARYPLPGVAALVIAESKRSPEGRKWMDRLGVLAKDSPAIAALLAAEAAEPPALVFVAQESPRAASELDVLGREQLVIASERYDGSKRSIEAIFAARPDDEGLVMRTVERWTITRGGVPAYDAWLAMGDSGTIFAHGTTRVVADVVQGGVECEDATLRVELAQARAERPRRAVAAKKKAPPKPRQKTAAEKKR